MESKFWGFRPAQPGREPEFVMLANARGSSSIRRFDAQTGELIEYDTSRGGGDYADVYGGVFRECQELAAPFRVTVCELKTGLPPERLQNLQQQVGMVATPGTVSVPEPERLGILVGTKKIINDTLQVDEGYKTETASLRLSKLPRLLDLDRLLDQLYQCVCENWEGSPCRSKELWRSCKMPEIARKNTSPEVTLEKAIVTVMPDWFNQIPTASGLIEGVEEKHRDIDLGHFIAPGHVELIELKAGEDAAPPVSAAFQIVQYAVLYCFARTHRERLGLSPDNRLLNAHQVDLKALGAAPAFCDPRYSLGWFEKALDGAIDRFAGRHFPGNLRMSFRFEQFPPWFQWPETPGDRIPQALASRQPVWR